MPAPKGLFSIPQNVLEALGDRLGAQLGAALERIAGNLQASSLHINIDVTVDLQSKQTATAVKARTARK